MFPAWNDDGIGSLSSDSQYSKCWRWAGDILSLFSRAPVSRVMEGWDLNKKKKNI